MDQKEIWNKIAKKWDGFRTKPAEEAQEFLLNKRGCILDLGCGSGRNFIKNKDINLFGIDFSSELLKLAEKNAKKMEIKIELKKAETSEIPYSSNFFDAVVFSRVLHCIDSEEKRKKSIEEIFRVLKPNSEVIISVWGRNQNRIKNKNKECFMPWTIDDKKYLRYTYIYDKPELEELLKSIGFEIISSREGKNIVIIARKPSS